MKTKDSFHGVIVEVEGQRTEVSTDNLYFDIFGVKGD